MSVMVKACFLSKMTPKQLGCPRNISLTALRGSEKNRRGEELGPNAKELGYKAGVRSSSRKHEGRPSRRKNGPGGRKGYSLQSLRSQFVAVRWGGG